MSADKDIIRKDRSETRDTLTEPLERSAAAGSETEPLEDIFAATTLMSRRDMHKSPRGTATQRPEAGSLLQDRFLLQEEVGNGGMGVVYKALDQRLAETDAEFPWVAIKVISPKLLGNPKALRILQQEANKIRCLAHPHIVRFIDLDREGDQYFLVMDWLEGRTLAAILDSADARNIDRIYAMRIVRQIGEALDYAHRCGIVHADVKPGNVMILPNGDAKLFDFGSARVRLAQSVTPDDQEVFASATPAYASMQVLTGETPVASDDVFSLACLLYRLVAGYRVFGPRNAADAAQAGMQPQRPQGFTDEQWSAMRKALSYSRPTRFAAVDEFIRAMDQGAEPLSVPPEPQAEEPEKPRGGRRWLAVPTVAVLFAAGVSISGQGRVWLDSILDPRAPPAVVANPERNAVISKPAIASPAARPVVDASPSVASTPVVENEKRAAEESKGSTVEAGALPVPAGARDKVVAVAAPPPMNTIGFSADEVQVRESDSAVQIDIVRDGSMEYPLTIGFTISDITATEGVDYFAPDRDTISFRAGEDTVRLLIPLVQDFATEGNESFALRLGEAAGISSTDGHQTAIITIRDDEPQIR